MNFNCLQKIAPVLNLCVGFSWIFWLMYISFDEYLNFTGTAFTYTFFLFFIHLPWIFLAYYYYGLRQSKGIIQSIVRHGEISMTTNNIIDTVSDEAPDALSVKAVNGFSIAKLLAIGSAIMQILCGSLGTVDMVYSLTETPHRIYSTILILILSFITFINGVLALYQIIIINRAAKKIRKIRAGSDEV